MARIKTLRAHGNAYGLNAAGEGWSKEKDTEYDHPDPAHLVDQGYAELVDQGEPATPPAPAPKKAGSAPA